MDDDPGVGLHVRIPLPSEDIICLVLIAIHKQGMEIETMHQEQNLDGCCHLQVMLSLKAE